MAQPLHEDNEARERAFEQVADVLLTVEHSLARARKAHRALQKSGADRNAELAMGDAVASLERTRKRLQQDALLAGNEVRLL